MFNIISPRYFLTVSDISVSLSPGKVIGIQVTLNWFTFEPLEAHVALFDCLFTNIRTFGSLKCFGITKVLGIVLPAVSLNP